MIKNPGTTKKTFAVNTREHLTVKVIFGFQFITLLILVIWVSRYKSTIALELDQPQQGTVFQVEPGIYDITVLYQSNDSENILTFEQKEKAGRLFADPLRCYSFQHEDKIRMWVLGNRQTIMVSVFQKNANSMIEIDRIVVLLTSGIQKLIITAAGLIFLLLDIGYIWFLRVYHKSENKKETLFCTILILVSIGVCSSYVFDPVFIGGSDYKFHFSRILGMAELIESGIFPPRILPFFFGDAGYATSLFYGDLLLIIPALLYIGGIPLYIAYHIFCLLISVGTAGISWIVFRTFADRFPALVATVFYTCALYRQFILIVHARLGEAIAMAVLPLTVGGMYLILREPNDQSKLRHGMRMLSAGMALLVMNHILSTFLCVLLLALWSLLYLNVVCKKQVLLTGVKAIITAVVLSAMFLVPFVEAMQSGAYEISNKVSDGDMWWMWIDRYSLLYLWPTDSYDAMYGLIPTLLHVVCCGYVLLRLIRKETRNRETYHLAVLTGMSVVWLFMASGWFPWNDMGNLPVFSLIKKTIQFPSRLAILSTVCLTFSLCEMVRLLCAETNKQRLYRVIALLGMLAIVVNTGVYVHALTDGTAQTAYPIYSAAGMNVDSNEYPASYTNDYFYLLQGTDPYQFAQMTDWMTNNPDLVVQDYEKCGTTVTFDCENLTTEEQKMTLPIIYYPYYQGIDTETGRNFVLTGTDTKAMLLTIPEQYEGTVTIKVAAPWYWTLALWVSVVAWVWMIGETKRNGKCSIW